MFAIAGAVTIAITAKECSASGPGPVVDSNFWSTLSQAFVGLARLYCIIIPILRRDEMKASDPRAFKVLLGLSLTTAVVSVIVYPLASLVLAFVSSLSQLAATLQLIKDSGNTIKVANSEIDFSERRIRAASCTDLVHEVALTSTPKIRPCNLVYQPKFYQLRC